MYSREIIYLTLYQENNRIGNAGYVKVDIRDGDAAFQFLCRNLPQTARGEYLVQVKADGIWRESGSMAVRDGQGSLRCKEKELQRVEKLQVLMENGYRAEGVGRACLREQSVMQAEEKRTGTEPNPERIPKEQSVMQPERVVPAKKIREDKWEQLLEMYDKIHPYGDERIYLRLEPKDFVILQEKYQHLVNNSFLLHGFYNYRYVILGKEKGSIYYLGVPGVFYEREKMVALMFGFEAFECEGGEAAPGGFGYYLRKVEL